MTALAGGVRGMTVSVRELGDERRGEHERNERPDGARAKTKPWLETSHRGAV